MIDKNLRELTEDEVQENFLNAIRSLIQYWSSLRRYHRNGEDDIGWRVEGMAFSILSILDGESVDLPGFIIAPDPHPDDKEDDRESGENWYPENDKILSKVKANISGSLHGLLRPYEHRPTKL